MCAEFAESLDCELLVDGTASQEVQGVDLQQVRDVSEGGSKTPFF